MPDEFYADFTCPNLDAMPERDIDRWADLFAELADYARTKSDAMFKRKCGSIVQAKKAEDTCEAIYKRLPESVRW